jgi:hypothetical protein
MAVADDLRVRSPGSAIGIRTVDFDDPAAIGTLVGSLAFEDRSTWR